MSEQITDTTMSLVAHQIELEKLYSKNQLIPRLRQEFTSYETFSFADYLIENEVPVQFGIDVLVQMALHKRCSLPTLVGLLRHHFDDAQLTVDMLKKCAEMDLIDWMPATEMFIVKVTISADVQEELDRFQFPLPMVVEPKEVTNNRQTGYFLNNGSIILKNNHHEDDVCLDHINRMNKMQFTIDLDTVIMIKNQWKNLDRVKEGETKQDFERRVKAFEKYDRTAKDVMQKLQEHSNTFHLTHRYDKRGRTYCQGYHVNYQGNAWNKAVINFANAEVTQ